MHWQLSVMAGALCTCSISAQPAPSTLMVRFRLACSYKKSYITLRLLAGRLVVIAHAPRDEGTRIISMRKGSRREQKIYQEQLGTD